jgi:transcriptional accessory protein Tex/SPT6
MSKTAVARYRKEATGGLEGLQLETLFKRCEYFLELAERREGVKDAAAMRKRKARRYPSRCTHI